MASYGGMSGLSNDFERLASSISTNIQKITQNLNKCQRLVSRIGTSADNNELTKQLHQLQHDTNELNKTTSIQLKNLAEIVRNSPQPQKKQRELTKNKLTDEFTSLLNKVQKVQREAVDKEHESVRRARSQSATNSNPFADTDETGGENSLVSFESENRKVSLQAVIDEEENLAAIAERERAIKSLESDILDVNQIFKDLGQIIYEQGETIDSIESNVESAAINVTQANTQLQQAAKYQSSARKKKIIIAVIVVVILLIVACAIAIPLAQKNKSN